MFIGCVGFLRDAPLGLGGAVPRLTSTLPPAHWSCSAAVMSVCVAVCSFTMMALRVCLLEVMNSRQKTPCEEKRSITNKKKCPHTA